MKSWYWRRNAWKPDSFLAPASLLGPCVRSRSAASLAVRPRSGSTSSCFVTAGDVHPVPGRMLRTGRRRALGRYRVTQLRSPRLLYAPASRSGGDHSPIGSRATASTSRYANAQCPESPTFTDTTAIATASAIRPSTSDRIRPAPASREATYAVTPIERGEQEPGHVQRRAERQEEERDGDDEGDRRGGRELRPDRPPGPAGEAPAGEEPGREVEREHVGEGHADRRSPDHRPPSRSRRRHAPRPRRTPPRGRAHVQGHRDGLANGLARGRAARRRDHARPSLQLAPAPTDDAAVWRKRERPPPPRRPPAAGD